MVTALFPLFHHLTATVVAVCDWIDLYSGTQWQPQYVTNHNYHHYIFHLIIISIIFIQTYHCLLRTHEYI